ncbi:MAG TPA: hypothetical protein VFS43_44200 [Polyangiaceae bacterium]|nr:hypothetical protein [Polyangiaceae bacterium]
MQEGELKLEFRPGGQKARLFDAVPAPERPIARLRWQPRDEADLPAALDAFERHPGLVRVSLAHGEGEPRSALALAGEARRRRPDALLTIEGSDEPQPTPPGLSLPLRCAGLVGLPGPRFDDFATWASERGLLALETIELDDVLRLGPRVLHLPSDGRDDLLAEVERRLLFRWADVTAAAPPSLVVVEWAGGSPYDSELPRWVRRLSAAGCGAVLAVKGEGPGGLDEAMAWLYRKIAHDRPLDWVARDLSKRGHEALLALSHPDAEDGVSLRRAALQQRRLAGVRLEGTLDWKPKPPQSELEDLLARRAARAVAELARVAHDISALEVEHDERAIALLEEKGRQADAIVGDAARALEWAFAPPAERPRGHLESFDPGGPAAMPARALRALPRRGGVELRGGVLAGEAFELDLSIDFVESIRELRLPGLSAPISLGALERAFGEAEAIEIELTLWAPKEHFEVTCEAPRLSLPRMGASTTARFELRARELPPGVDEAVRRLRVGAYHRNRLLQSLVVDVAVGRTRAPRRGPAQGYDYAVSDELLSAGEGPARRLSLFVNDGADGTHWIGARVEGSSKAYGAPITLLADEAKGHAARLHAKLREASALGKGDRYATPWAQIDADHRAARERRLVELAQLGRDLYISLFASDGEGVIALEGALGPPDGHVEIARCRDEAPALPWQLVYDLPLSLAPPPSKQPALCRFYLQELDRPGARPDRPGQCASRRGCPHREALGGAGAPGGEALDQAGAPGGDAAGGDAAGGDTPGSGALKPELTVCPFGFWGSRHKIAQPLANRSSEGTVPTRRPSGRRGLTVGYFSFENASAHVGRIAPAEGEGRHASTHSVATLRDYLTKRDDAIIYLYCHGTTVGHRFFLQFGETEEAREYLGASDLATLRPRWAHGPIVVLNGCQTLRVQPTSLNQLLGVLRKLGAAAIIGPEIEMFTTSAAKVGEAIVAGALERVPLDELMLRIRRELLRELSPMGLAYNVYAPSGLAWSPPGEAAPGR